MVNIANILEHPSEKSKKIFFRISSLITKGEFTQYPFFVRFCFSLKKYALFHPHFYMSISALSIDC